MRTVLSTNHVDSRSFSSRCWGFRRTHSSADPIRLLCIRLALPLTLSLPSGFVPSTKLMVGASPRALGLVKDFSCDCTFWDERGGGLAPVGPRVDQQLLEQYCTNRVDSGSFSSGCTYTHERRPFRLIRLALPLTLPLPLFAPSARLHVPYIIHTYAQVRFVQVERVCPLALPLTLSLTSRLAPRARLCSNPGLGIFLRRKKRCAGRV